MKHLIHGVHINANLAAMTWTGFLILEKNIRNLNTMGRFTGTRKITTLKKDWIELLVVFSYGFVCPRNLIYAILDVQKGIMAKYF